MIPYRFLSVIVITLLLSCENFSDRRDIQENNNADPAVSNFLMVGELGKRYQKALNEENDTIRHKMLLNISYDALHKGDDDLFLKANRQAEALSLKLTDISGLSGAYWDRGEYYYRLPKKDSAYFYYDKAQKLYHNLGDDLSSGRLLLNLAIIQKDIKDYTGSEVTTTSAITLLSSFEDYFSLYLAYNNLGIVFNELGEYERALFYHNKAVTALKKTSLKDRLPSLYNNIGVVYDNKKEHQTAIKYFDQALKADCKLSETNPKIYAMVIDNRAYAQLHLGQLDQVYNAFNKALKIRESLPFKAGVSVSRIHLAEYFLSKGDTTNATEQALKAESFARDKNNIRDLLNATRFLATVLHYRPLYYSQHYIQLNDSLSFRERAVRNKFARIRMETDEYIHKTENLHRRIIRISIIAAGVFIIFILLYIIKTQRSRAKFLEQKRRANQAIYNLKLTQQKHFERGMEEEKHRVSRELHNGILAELFGVRLSLGALNNRDDKESKKGRLNHLVELQEITRKIRRISHTLGKDSVKTLDFSTILKEYIAKQPKTVDLRLQIDKNLNWKSVDDMIKINVYRMLQEAISNIYKHAEATTAHIDINQVKSFLVVRINDNGKGFSSGVNKRGIGLRNMKIRVQTIRGKLRIRSGVYGTQLRIIVDLSHQSTR